MWCLCCMSGVVNFTVHDVDNAARVEQEMVFWVKFFVLSNVYDLTWKIWKLSKFHDLKFEKKTVELFKITRLECFKASDINSNSFTSPRLELSPAVFRSRMKCHRAFFILTLAAIKAAFHKSCYLMTAPRHRKEDV
jgi:hypothetical protein